MILEPWEGETLAQVGMSMIGLFFLNSVHFEYQ